MQTNSRRSLTILLLGWILFSPCHLVTLSPCQAHEIDSPMYHDPDLPPPPIEYFFPEKTQALWLKALQQPQADLRCKAADAIARARERGVKGLEVFIPDLL